MIALWFFESQSLKTSVFLAFAAKMKYIKRLPVLIFAVKTFFLDNVKNILIESISDNPINEYIVKEMLNIFSEYEKENKKTLKK